MQKIKRVENAAAVVRFKMAEAVSKQMAKDTFPHLIHLRGLKVSLPLHWNWQGMLWLLVREEPKRLLYPTLQANRCPARSGSLSVAGPDFSNILESANFGRIGMCRA